MVGVGEPIAADREDDRVEVEAHREAKRANKWVSQSQTDFPTAKRFSSKERYVVDNITVAML